jgi:hypothetical protein
MYCLGSVWSAHVGTNCCCFIAYTPPEAITAAADVDAFDALTYHLIAHGIHATRYDSTALDDLAQYLSAPYLKIAHATVYMYTYRLLAYHQRYLCNIYKLLTALSLCRVV